MSLLGTFFALALQLSFVHFAWALVNCTMPGFSWATNTINQNPCTVSELLEGACVNAVDTLQPLNPGMIYTGPNSVSPPCQCNTVVYSTLQACAACQNGSIVPWSDYSKPCVKTVISSFPISIPNTTRIPHWAYLDVTASNFFSVQNASIAGGLESTASLNPSTYTSSIGSSSTSSAFMITSSPSTLSTSSVSSSIKSSNTGAIAGGIIGGILGLALIGGIIVYLNHRRRRQQIMFHDEPLSLAPMIQFTPHLKQYDPDDPSTFPSTPDKISNKHPSARMSIFRAYSAYSGSRATSSVQGFRGHAEL